MSLSETERLTEADPVMATDPDATPLTFTDVDITAVDDISLDESQARLTIVSVLRK